MIAPSPQEALRGRRKRHSARKATPDRRPPFRCGQRPVLRPRWGADAPATRGIKADPRPPALPREAKGLACAAPPVPRRGGHGFLQTDKAPKAGPYLHGHVNDANDPFTDTPLRIRKTMQHYASVTGAVPDMVVYQTNLWDAYGKGFDASLKQYNKSLDMLDRYYHNTLYNLDLVIWI